MILQMGLNVRYRKLEVFIYIFFFNVHQQHLEKSKMGVLDHSGGFTFCFLPITQACVFIDLIERGRETNTDVREKHQYVPRPGIEPTT